eukprot:symbB.v1.2.001117.t1/scaffold46.1/size430244/8
MATVQALQDGEPPTQPRTAVDGGSLLRLAWALAVINEALPMQLLEDLVNLPLPKDWGGYGLRQLQEVALHHQIQDVQFCRLYQNSTPMHGTSHLLMFVAAPVQLAVPGSVPQGRPTCALIHGGTLAPLAPLALVLAWPKPGAARSRSHRVALRAERSAEALVQQLRALTTSKSDEGVVKRLLQQL